VQGAATSYDRCDEKAKWRIWRKARLVGCTASSAVHVIPVCEQNSCNCRARVSPTLRYYFSGHTDKDPMGAHERPT
jgi:hypothetical protein